MLLMKPPSFILYNLEKKKGLLQVVNPPRKFSWNFSSLDENPVCNQYCMVLSCGVIHWAPCIQSKASVLLRFNYKLKSILQLPSILQVMETSCCNDVHVSSPFFNLLSKLCMLFNLLCNFTLCLGSKKNDVSCTCITGFS